MKPQMALAKAYKAGVDVRRCAVSEKLDGVRAWWTGSELVSRGGKRINAPYWFTANLPAGFALDGELWAGRGGFQSTCSAVMKAQPVEAEWRRIKFMAFDFPSCRAAFHDRLAALLRLEENECFGVVPQIDVESHSELLRALDGVVAEGGEGLVLSHLDAPHEAGRTDNLLKLKPCFDAEGEVIGHARDFDGEIRALVVRVDAGEFKLSAGLTKSVRAHPPSIGCTVTFEYEGLTDSGLPRFARFARKRTDQAITVPPAAVKPVTHYRNEGKVFVGGRWRANPNINESAPKLDSKAFSAPTPTHTPNRGNEAANGLVCGQF